MLLLVVVVGATDVKLLVIAERVLGGELEVDKTETVAVGVLEVVLELEVDKTWKSAERVLETILELDDTMTDVSAVEAGRTIALTTRLGVAAGSEVETGSAESSSSAAFRHPPHDLVLQVREEPDEAGMDEDTGAGVVLTVEVNKVDVWLETGTGIDDVIKVV